MVEDEIDKIVKKYRGIISPKKRQIHLRNRIKRADRDVEVEFFGKRR